jgi:hypothetical protein
MHPSQPIPEGDQTNQYDFIMNEQPKPKKTLLPKNNSKKQRIAIFVGFGLLLITLLIVVFSLIFGSSSSGTNNLIRAVKQQQEIIRIAEVGEKSARTSVTQSFATSTKLTVSTSQSEMLKYLEGRDLKLKGKELAEEFDPKTDAQLKTATENGTFDEVLTAILVKQLTDYGQNLSDYYDGESSKARKQLLENAFGQVQGLLDSQKATVTEQ